MTGLEELGRERFERNALEVCLRRCARPSGFKPAETPSLARCLAKFRAARALLLPPPPAD